MNRRIDPAALLIAVLTVGVDPLTTNGPWEKINTIVATVVGVILAAYTWPRKVGAEPEASLPPADNWILAAQAIAYGLIIAIAAGWPVHPVPGAEESAREAVGGQRLNQLRLLCAAAGVFRELSAPGA